jgi:tetratricopeptide (TPR) repeat protein
MSTSLPETIGSFRILAKLGQGGMGTVYRAMHGTLERPVALKILPNEFSNNPEYVMRFLREARTIAALRHENVVQVYDAGEHAGQYFIAMELVDGSNLGTYADEHQKVDEKEGLELLLQAAKGLAAAHANGLVHRDIKPENLLLGKDKILRIVDFGLVMESTSTTQLTATGACLGTPMYMSPEQADGENADARTDIYSLGVTFYRVFTGQTPFTSPTVMNLLFKHKFEMPRDPKAVRPDLSTNVNSLLLHMLAKRREDRPQTAQKLIEMIELIKQGKSIPPPPRFVPPISPSSQEMTAVSVPSTYNSGVESRRRAPILGIIVICLILGVLVTLFYVLSRQATSPTESSTETAVAVAPSPVHVTPVTNQATPGPDGAADPNDDALKRGDTAFADGKLRTALDEYKIGLALDPRNATLTERVYKTEKAMAFKDALDKGVSLEGNGQWEEALGQYTSALQFDTGMTAQQHIDALNQKLADQRQADANTKNGARDAEIKKAEAAEKSYRYDVAAEHYSRAAMLSDPASRLTLAEKAQECRRQDYIAQGKASESLNNYAEAEKYYKKALDLKADSALELKIEALHKKIPPAPAPVQPAQIIQPPPSNQEKDFHDALAAARQAMNAGDFRGARAKLDAAKKIMPSQPEAASLGLEIEGRELVSQGDALQSKGDSAQAVILYRKAETVCPAIRTLTQARIAASLASALPPSALTERIDAQVKAYKDDEASADVANELRQNPKSAQLLLLKDALDGTRNAGWIYHELAALCEKARAQVSDALDLDDDDRTIAERKLFRKLIEESNEKSGRARQLFLQHDYEGVQSTLSLARSDAGDAVSKFSAAADFFEKRVEHYEQRGGVTVPIVGVSISGNRKKAERYQRIVDEFHKYVEQAKNLRKFGDR